MYINNPTKLGDLGFSWGKVGDVVARAVGAYYTGGATEVARQASEAAKREAAKKLQGSVAPAEIAPYTPPAAASVAGGTSPTSTIPLVIGGAALLGLGWYLLSADKRG